MIWMLDIPGTCVAGDSEEAEEVKKRNEQYSEVGIPNLSNLSMNLNWERGMPALLTKIVTMQKSMVWIPQALKKAWVWGYM